MIIARSIVAVILISITSTALAQRPPQMTEKSAEEKAKFNTERMTERLQLSEAQQSEVYLLQLEMQESIEKVHSEESTSKQKRLEIAALHENMKTDLQKVLTPEQQTQLQEHASSARGRRTGGHSAQRLEHLKTTLELSDEQVSQLREAFEQNQSQSKEAMRETMQEVLTEAQLEKLDAMKAEMEGKSADRPRGPRRQ